MILAETYNNVLWDQISAHINKKYHVLETIDLSRYAPDPRYLLSKLACYKDKTFLDNERIVFYHFESDYYFNNSSFLLYNFIRILKHLNIPLFSVLVFSAHHGVTNIIKSTVDQLWPGETLQLVETSYVKLLSNYNPSKLDSSNVENISHPFILLNGKPRSHRMMLLCLLEELAVLNKGIVTYNFSDTAGSVARYVDSGLELDSSSDIFFLNTFPFTSNNDEVFWTQEFNNIFLNHHQKFSSTTTTHPLVSNYGGYVCDVEEHYSRAFLYVITESLYNSPTQFLTEKTFKAFVNRRPFVFVGPANSLSKLRDLGFKTFDTVVDESYDTISDPSKRLAAIGKILQEISSKSIEDLKHMCYNIESVIDYNYNHYHNTFCKKDLYKLICTI